ncbi:hypothetical protein ACQCVP_19680 [Rossellomorea vietnamensis]|uniref:hypothetical protein n=1 Tax=Rossellomorea vietnamensis TaxID=218284 RepID=UPI003CFB4330
MKRKELLSPIRERTLSIIPGENPALGIFPKAAIYAKTAIDKELSRLSITRSLQNTLHAAALPTIAILSLCQRIN